MDPTGSTWSFNGANNWNGGGLHTSDDYGSGMVDARAAVRLAETWQDKDTSISERQLSTVLPTFTIASGKGQFVAWDASKIFQNLSFDVEHVDVTLTLQNVVLGDLLVQLVGPTGETSTLFNGPTSGSTLPNAMAPQNLTWTMDSVKGWGEQGAAAWQLYVYYAAGTNPGTGNVTGGSLTIDGRYSPNGHITDASTPAEKTYVNTDEFDSLSADPNNAVRGTLNDSGAHITLNAAAITSNSTIDVRPGSSGSLLAGRALSTTGNTVVTAVFGGDGNDLIIGNSAGVFSQAAGAMTPLPAAPERTRSPGVQAMTCWPAEVATIPSTVAPATTRYPTYGPRAV